VAYRVACAIVGEHRAPDVVQDSFVSAWRSLKNLKDPQRFDPWLYRIVVNRSRSVLRSQRLVREVPLDVAESAAAVDARATVEARIVLGTALRQLSPDQRVVIALHYAAGMSLAEIGNVLGLPVGTVKSRLNAALTRLRTMVQEV
jgi:RNA polymerase sigma-70 factor (ECF subfamily)